MTPTESTTPLTDTLWGNLMDACRECGIAPATVEAFGQLDKFRQLETELNTERSHADRLAAALESLHENNFRLYGVGYVTAELLHSRKEALTAHDERRKGGV